MAKPKRTGKHKSRPGRLRIVAGKWRGRLLPVVDQAGLRPTSERVRETLFNWLSEEIVGSRCLDLFAGSGALGLEALSRGASYVLMIDTVGAVTQVLKESATSLAADNVVIETIDAATLLERVPDNPFDIVFLDPPYSDDLLEHVALLLQSNGWLRPQSLVYVECDKKQPIPSLPENWRIEKDKVAGNVRYMLVRVN